MSNAAEIALQITAAKYGVTVQEVVSILALTEAQREAIDKWWEDRDDDEFDYRDNERFAVKGDVEQEVEYERLRSQGCCGSVDIELPCDDGSVLLYGFNYGH